MQGVVIEYVLLLYIVMTYSGTYPPFVNQTLSRHNVIWQCTVTILAMTHAKCGLKVLTITIYSDDIFGDVAPHLSIKFWLNITSFGNVLLLCIAMTHAGCALRIRTITINSDDIFGHVTPLPVNQILFKHDVIWQHLTKNSDESLLRKRFLATLMRKWDNLLLRWHIPLICTWLIFVHTHA